jgi:hypothetical protein
MNKSQPARTVIIVAGSLTEILLFLLVWTHTVADTLYTVMSLSVLGAVLVSAYRLEKTQKGTNQNKA